MDSSTRQVFERRLQQLYYLILGLLGEAMSSVGEFAATAMHELHYAANTFPTEGQDIHRDIVQSMQALVALRHSVSHLCLRAASAVRQMMTHELYQHFQRVHALLDAQLQVITRRAETLQMDQP